MHKKENTDKLTSAPYFSNNSATFSCPSRQAVNNAVRPNLSTWSTLTPATSNHQRNITLKMGYKWGYKQITKSETCWQQQKTTRRYILKRLPFWNQNSKGVDRYGTRGHVPNIWTGNTITSVSLLFEESSCLYPTRRNAAELWIFCNVLFVCMVLFNHKAVMVKIRCIFQLIFAVDFMTFYFIKTQILLQCWQEAPAYGSGTPLPGLCP